MRIERAGQQRWLVVQQTPEQLWPQLRQFWEKSGFTLALDNPQVGVMETQWSENRAKLPNDAIRNVIGRVLGNLYDSGERDQFRTRVERGPAGTEIFISHRGIQEVYTDAVRENTTWRARPSEPELEAEFLGRLMLALTTRDEAPPSRTATTQAAAQVAAAPDAPPRARLVEVPGGSALEVDEAFDRAWRRVGLALDRGGFTVEDRDRSKGTYFVRYLDPELEAKQREAQGLLSKMFGGDPKIVAQQFRLFVEGSGAATQVRVLDKDGKPEASATRDKILAQLTEQMR